MDNMKKSMTDELEQRRLAWEQEVAKMQQDFFKVRDSINSSDILT